MLILTMAMNIHMSVRYLQYRKDNPGSKLKTAVTTPPSKLKKGSKAWKRRKSFCARSRKWKSERGKAARRKWNC